VGAAYYREEFLPGEQGIKNFFWGRSNSSGSKYLDPFCPGVNNLLYLPFQIGTALGVLRSKHSPAGTNPQGTPVTLPEIPDRIRWKPSGVAYRGYPASQGRVKRPDPERFNLGFTALCLIGVKEIRPSQVNVQIDEPRSNPYIF
jgi:hypothetical protein